MKTKLISCIAVMMISIMAMSFTNKATDKNTILIESTDTKISKNALTESAGIISARLNDFCTGKIEVTVIPGKNQLQVAGINESDILVAEKLMTQQGKIEFYRAYDQVELSGILKGDTQLFSMLNTTEVKDSYSRVGCTSLSKIEKVNQFLTSKEPMQKCRFVWGEFTDSTEVCLYGLKVDKNNVPMLTGKDFESATYKQDQAAKFWQSDFSFKKPAVKLWSEITKQNINHAIAIVIDNHVICAPVIRSVIESGKCSITGNFTETDVRLFAAFGNHGELPASFRVVR